MESIKNSNGSIYYILYSFYNEKNNRNILLLSSYKGKEISPQNIEISQFIIAKNYRKESKNWDSGKYFLCNSTNLKEIFDETQSIFIKEIQNIL